MACASSAIKLASSMGGNRTIWTRITCDQTVYGPPLNNHVKTVGCCGFAASPRFGGSKEDEITPEGCTNVAIYEIQDSKLSSFLQTEANRAAG